MRLGILLCAAGGKKNQEQINCCTNPHKNVEKISYCTDFFAALKVNYMIFSSRSFLF